MIIGNSGIITFETEDKIIKFISNVLNNQVPYAYCYGKRNIYYLSDLYVYIPYESIQNENIRKRISEMNESYEPYDFLYNSNIGERIKIKSLTLIAPRDENDNIERYFEIQVDDVNEYQDNDVNEYQNEIDEVGMYIRTNEIDENVIYNGTNKMVKIFNQKCVICLENDSVYAFRNCGHMCLCENCFDSKITKCIVCRCT